MVTSYLRRKGREGRNRVTHTVRESGAEKNDPEVIQVLDQMSGEGGEGIAIGGLAGFS
jgi:hypothetical protein